MAHGFGGREEGPGTSETAGGIVCAVCKKPSYSTELSDRLLPTPRLRRQAHRALLGRAARRRLELHAVQMRSLRFIAKRVAHAMRAECAAAHFGASASSGDRRAVARASRASASRRLPGNGTRSEHGYLMTSARVESRATGRLRSDGCLTMRVGGNRTQNSGITRVIDWGSPYLARDCRVR